MEQKKKRTITEVLDRDTGDCVFSDNFFKKPLDEITIYRSELQQAIEGYRDPRFVCYYCKQKIRIRGGFAPGIKRKAEIFHFAHLKDSDECHLKTKNKLTKEEVDCIRYNGAKESKLHESLKNKIAICLRVNEEKKGEVSYVEVEKVIKEKLSKEWKKPDINALFHNKRIAFELQLSTTWLDVITRRQNFYFEHGIFIFWIFNTFDPNDDVRKLVFNDVIYTNKQNAYVFDEETYKRSIIENDLILKCYYKNYSLSNQELIEKWEEKFIKLSDLTFDETNFKIFYHNADEQKKKLQQEISDHNSQLEELNEKINELNNRIKDTNKCRIELKHEEKIGKEELTNLKKMISESPYYISNLANNFLGKKSYNHNLSIYSDLFEQLSNEFGEQIRIECNKLEDYNQECNSLKTMLEKILNLKTIKFESKIYSKINTSEHLDIIKSNYLQIKTIRESFEIDLFTPIEPMPINNEFELNQKLNLRDIILLFDFTSIIEESKEKQKQFEILINHQNEVIRIIHEKIKSIFEQIIGVKISKEENKLYNQLESIKKFDIDLKESTIELTKLKKTKELLLTENN